MDFLLAALNVSRQGSCYTQAPDAVYSDEKIGGKMNQDNEMEWGGCKMLYKNSTCLSVLIKSKL